MRSCEKLIQDLVKICHVPKISYEKLKEAYKILQDSLKFFEKLLSNFGLG